MHICGIMCGDNQTSNVPFVLARNTLQRIMRTSGALNLIFLQRGGDNGWQTLLFTMEKIVLEINQNITAAVMYLT